MWERQWVSEPLEAADPVRRPAIPVAATPGAVPVAATTPRSRPTERPRLQRSDRGVTGRGVTGRGVTGRGTVVLIVLVTLIVGILEVVIAGQRGHLFGIAFVATSVIGALVVRRRDLPTAMIAPPLLYCALIVAMSAFDTKDQTGGFVTRETFYVANAFVTGAPAIWIGSAAAALIGWYRLRAR